MTTDFPTSLDSLTNPDSSSTMVSVPHVDQHANANDAIESLQTKVGVDNSAVTTSHDYKISTLEDEMDTAQTDINAAEAALTAHEATVHDLGSAFMHRQAIINGNFQVWQRGTTNSTFTDATNVFMADCWRDSADDDGGTKPTLSRTRELLTSGDIFASYFYNRLTSDGAGTSLGSSSLHSYIQGIEHGTRSLAGNGRKVTLSFYARSSVADKRLGVLLLQNYGTGGSPTAQETIAGTNFTLTSTWTQYTHTFTLNTLAGKTFGTSGNDQLKLVFRYVWGSSLQTDVGAASAETYVGSGTTDIAQVQLCSGEEALPFQTKSYDDELRACLRYCWVPSPATQDFVGWGSAYNTTGAYIFMHTPVPMSGSKTLTCTADHYELWDPAVGATALTAISLSTSTNYLLWFLITVASGLTAYRQYYLRADTSIPRLMIISADLV